ncbi:MAG: cytochrome c biogenesis protein CcdA, partial [Bacteroidales bacterium]|nr:cytochrome c biogenesis protein CcdA [Bacteroidales bacterium]
MNRHKLFLLFVSFFIFQQLSAQIAEPVKWSFSQQKISDDEVLLVFNANVEQKWHLYTQFFPDGGPLKLSFKFEDSKNYKRIGKVSESPAPKKVYDDIFEMEVQYISGKAVFTQKVKVLSENDFVIKGEIEGQACNDVDGSCVPFYPEFEFKIKGAKTKVESSEIEQDTIKYELVAQKDSLEVDTLEMKMSSTFSDTTKHITPVTNVNSDINLENGSLGLLFWISFLAGLLAILTPCVFPMIPMTVSFFMKSGESKVKGRMQALFYGISIIVIYTVIGTLVAVLFGVNFANWLSTHWIPNVLFFLIFIFFAASFLGMFEITLPSWIVNKSDSQVDKGGIWAPFFMAFTLVLVSFSCTGPLVGAILVKSAGGAVLEPIVGMLGFSLAFALPFTLFAFFPSWLSNLPKSGGWLNSVKVVLGFIEIALGFKFLSVADQTYHWGILDREIYIAIWVV